jgi:hypothetical protein
VHRQQILEQWKSQLSNFLGVIPKEIGVLHGAKKKRTGKLDLAMIQTLTKSREIEEITGDYEQVIIDGCQQSTAIASRIFMSKKGFAFSILIVLVSTNAYSLGDCKDLLGPQPRSGRRWELKDSKTGARVSKIQPPDVVYSWFHMAALKKTAAKNEGRGSLSSLFNSLSKREKPTAFFSNWPQFGNRDALFTWINPATASRGADAEEYGQVLGQFKIKPNARAVYVENSQILRLQGGQQFFEAFDTTNIDIVLNGSPREWVIINPAVIENYTLDPMDFRGVLEAEIRKLEDPNHQYQKAETHYGDLDQPANANDAVLQGRNYRNYVLYRLKQLLRFGVSIVPHTFVRPSQRDETGIGKDKEDEFLRAMVRYQKADSAENLRSRFLSLLKSARVSDEHFKYYVETDANFIMRLLTKSYEGLKLRLEVDIRRLLADKSANLPDEIRQLEPEQLWNQIGAWLRPLYDPMAIRSAAIFDSPADFMSLTATTATNPLRFDPHEIRRFLLSLGDASRSFSSLVEDYGKLYGADEQAKRISVHLSTSMITE